MPGVVAVGAQWGDEGKGKIVDIWARSAAAVVRFGGGANAGHTLVIEGRKLVTHLVPSGVLHRGTRCILGEGMVIDPDSLLEEISSCRERDLLPPEDLMISAQAHVILPFHRLIEAAREAGKHSIGTTLRGIGPAYEAKAARRGVRMGDLGSATRLRELFEQNMEELVPLLRHYGADVPDDALVDGWIAQALAAGEKLAPSVCNTGRVINDMLDAGDNVLFEGAQGAMLDVDHGTYPYVTSGSTVAAGASQGAGVGPTRIDSVVGISKAYATRVGNGPFPTELHGAEGEALRQAGSEFGATTGRPRRCGWLDLPALRLAIRINGMSGIALTKLDVLGAGDDVKVCVSYRLDGRELDELPADPAEVARAEPVFETFPGWTMNGEDMRSLDDLPATARSYLDALQARAGIPFYVISVGPDRSHTIELRDPFSTP